MSQKRKATELSITPAKRARKVLTLAKKVQVIEYVDSGANNVKTAMKFGCGRTQIGNILLNRKAILETYGNGRNCESKYLQQRPQQYPGIDEAVWKFFCEGRTKNMPINGELLKSEALEVMAKLKLQRFYCF